ncbi:TetR/AcrR family transcriptional regulator [Streptomyces sp. QTS52]
MTEEGVRARKARQTKQRIAEVGLRLFLDNGFEATTLDMIAAGADVSRRTLFHYFDSKDAILTAWVGELEELVRSVVAEQPPEVAPLAAVQQAMHALTARYQTEEALAIDRLMRSTDALRARKQANYERQERSLYAALAERRPDPARQPELRLVAVVGIGVLRLAIENWGHDAHRGPLSDHLDVAFATLRSALAPNEAPPSDGRASE